MAEILHLVQRKLEIACRFVAMEQDWPVQELRQIDLGLWAQPVDPADNIVSLPVMIVRIFDGVYYCASQMEHVLVVFGLADAIPGFGATTGVVNC